MPARKRPRKSDRDDHGDSFRGFKIKITPSKPGRPRSRKKAKLDSAEKTTTQSDAVLVQEKPFPEAKLSAIQYKIEPEAAWNSLRRYRAITLRGQESPDGVQEEETIEFGQIVFVNGTEKKRIQDPSIKNWIAQILEIRGPHLGIVYLRIAYLYRPEDLPCGRQPYHGGSELIVSNHMDIIEATTVLDIADVSYWNEDLEGEFPDEDQLFWRQSYDLRGKKLSKLRPFCIDKEPCNPDQTIIACEACDAWLHPSCIEKQAIADAWEKWKVENPAKKGVKEPPFTADLQVLESDQLSLTVTDTNGSKLTQRNVEVRCLICSALIEEAIASKVKVESAEADGNLTIPVSTPSRSSSNETVFQSGLRSVKKLLLGTRQVS